MCDKKCLGTAASSGCSRFAACMSTSNNNNVKRGLKIRLRSFVGCILKKVKFGLGMYRSIPRWELRSLRDRY